MKKRIVSVALSVVMVVCLVGCGTTYQEAAGQTESNSATDYGNGYFTVITKWKNATGTYRIVYANDTKVKYLTIIGGGGSRFGITPLYNADGTLQIYEESKD